MSKTKDKEYIQTDILGIKQKYYNIDTLEVSDFINPLITSNDRDDLYFSTILKFGYNYDNRTPYKNIKRVLPDEIVQISKDEKSIQRVMKPDFSFDLQNKINLKELLIEQVKQNLSEIPDEVKQIGVLLSGGIDSSIVSAILLKLKEEGYFNKELKFFSINNSEDEEYIRIFEKVFNISTKMLEYDLSNISDEQMKEILDINETPVDLGSLVPTYVMFKELQKQNIKYIFTGDGPDELFGGYKRMDEYDSQLSDIFQELSFYHFPRLNKLANHFGFVLKTPWVSEEMVGFAINLPLDARTHKQIIKDTFKGFIPDEIIYREKRPLKNDLVKNDKREYRNKLVNLFYELMRERRIKSWDKPTDPERYNIVVFGLDNSGKTTLCSNLAEYLSDYTTARFVHSFGNVPLEKQLDFIQKELIDEDEFKVHIFDRFPVIEEQVYGIHLRGYNRYADLNISDKLLSRMSLFIFCNPGFDKISNWGDREQMEGVIEKSEVLYKEYLNIYQNLIDKGYNIKTYDYTKDDYKNLVKDFIERLS